MSFSSDPPLIKRLTQLDSNLLADVMHVGGLPDQILAPALRPVGRALPLIGVAVCGRGEPVRAGAAPSNLSLLDFDPLIYKGAVVVIEYGAGEYGALIGGLVVHNWQDQGCSGLLTDGLVRDSADFERFAFPAFAGGATPAPSTGRWALVEVGGRARLPKIGGGHVDIADGDLILGDADGVAIVPSEPAEAIISAAETLKAIESNIEAAMNSGMDRKRAFELNPRFKHVSRFVQ